LFLIGAGAIAGAACAQSQPTRPVRFVVPAAAGGAIDAFSRVLAQRLTEHWGRQVVVENRSGAGGNIAIDLVAKAPPDGHTFLTVSQSFAVNPSVYKDVGWDPVRDFTAVMLVATTNGVLLVPPSLPVHSVKDLIALAKSQPGGLSYSSTGSGTSGHMNMLLFIQLTGINVVHVPYKDVGQAQTDLMSGRVQLYIAPMPGFVAHIKAGRMRALAATGLQRSAVLPDVPTMQEAGVAGYEAVTWYGFYGPAKLPRETVAQVNADVGTVLRRADVKERLDAIGFDIVGSTPEHLAKYLREEVVKWANVAKAMKVRAD
jgi:tripartite-type tricarboxylate transporter receptor subunit TctC